MLTRLPNTITVISSGRAQFHTFHEAKRPMSCVLKLGISEKLQERAVGYKTLQ
jgi:hypothetical protein